MKKYYIITLPLFLATLCFGTDVDSLNIQSMYEGAKEMEMLNKSMEAGMREHNQKSQPILIETTETVMDKTPLEGFQELNDKFFLEKVIEDSKNTKVTVTTSGNMVKIKTVTVKKEYKSTQNGMAESSYNSSSEEEISVPENADITKLTKEYRDGILKIFVPKK